MLDSIPSSSVYTDIQGLSELKLKAREDSPEALQEVARQFEAMFLQMMLKSMREASQGEGIFDSDQSLFYRDMFDQQIALDLSQGQNSIGLAEVMIRQLQINKSGNQEQLSENSLLNPVNVPVPRSEIVKPVVAAESIPQTSAVTFVDTPLIDKVSFVPDESLEVIRDKPLELIRDKPLHIESSEDFIQSLWPYAEKAGEKLGLMPETLLAQAALETGWGKAIIQHHDGQSSYNLFNIKANHHWSGEQVAKQTVEYRDGVAVREQASFRSYASYQESFDDYVQFIESSPRYREALERAGDPNAYVKALQSAGYATDPAYADKVLGIMKRDVMVTSIEQLKNPEAETLI